VYRQNCESFDICEMLKPYTKEELEAMVIELSRADHAIYQVVYNKVSTDSKWCKLFIHGLAPNTTKGSLTRAFQQFGTVKEAIVLLEQHDRSKGCGFVIFETALSARQALSIDVMVDGRVVQCDYAFKGNAKKVFINRPVITPEQRLEADGRRLFIHDLAWKTTNETLRQSFLQYGEIQEAVVIPDRKTGKSKGFGFVTFLSAEAARRALRDPVKRIDDRNAKVAYAKPTKDAEVPVAPYQSPSPSNGSVGSMGSLPSTTNVSMHTAPLPPVLKRPSLDLNNYSNSSNGSIGSIGSNMTSCSTSMSVPAYSIANSNSAPPSMPMFTPSSVSNAWPVNGYPALPYISVSNQSTPSQQGTPQGTPVSTPVLTNNSSVQTPPFISMQHGVQVVHQPVHPSMLPPPPSPHSLGLRPCSSQEMMKGGVQSVQLVNIQGVLQNAFVIPQSQ